MRSQTWLATVLVLIACGAGLSIAGNAALDPYGLFRNTRSRKLLPYGDSRIAKYLLSARYVPENFNALLIGTSVSANWNLSGVEKLRIYNESVTAGTIVEEEAIAQQALSSPG